MCVDVDAQPLVVVAAFVGPAGCSVRGPARRLSARRLRRRRQAASAVGVAARDQGRAVAIPGDCPRTDYRSLHARYIRPARATDTYRRTLDSPARPLLDWLAAQGGVAVTGVTVSPASLADVYGYLVEPCHRLGVPLTIVADRALHDLSELEAAEPQVGYAWSLQRLRYLCGQQSPPRRWPAASPADELDDSQLAAVSAHDGVVQIIAPAGSGKTTVLIARAAELVARGVPAERILCTTFNKDAQRELQARLLAAGLDDVRAQTFHSVGYSILRDCDGLRSAGVRTLSLGQWRRICAVASRASPENDRAAACPLALSSRSRTCSPKA